MLMICKSNTACTEPEFSAQADFALSLPLNSLLHISCHDAAAKKQVQFLHSPLCFSHNVITRIDSYLCQFHHHYQQQRASSILLQRYRLPEYHEEML